MATTMGSKVGHKGEYYLKKCSLALRGKTLKLAETEPRGKIIHSLFSGFAYCVLYVDDSDGAMQEKHTPSGGEELDLEIEVEKGQSFSKKFNLVKAGLVQKDAVRRKKRKMMKLEFYEKNAWEFITKKYSKHFKNKKAKEIIDHYLKKMAGFGSLGGITVEDNKPIPEFAMPFMSGQQLTRYLSKRSRSIADPVEDVGYFFYVNKDGEYVWTTLAKMMSLGPKHELKFETDIQDHADVDSHKVVIVHNTGNTVDLMSGHYSGGHGYRQKFVDPSDSAHVHYDEDKTGSAYMNSAAKLGKYVPNNTGLTSPNFSGHEGAHNISFPYPYYDDMSFYNDWIKNQRDNKIRMSTVQQNLQEMALRANFEVYSGDCVKFTRKSDNGKSINQAYSGKYLVFQVEYSFTTGGAQTNLYLLKDAFQTHENSAQLTTVGGPMFG